MKYYKTESRKDWYTTQTIGQEELNTGAILRIADSLEKIEQPYIKLLDTVEYLRTTNKNRLARIEKLEKQVAAYKGVITKMKKKA